MPLISRPTTAILLINTGSPDDPGVLAVARYLSKFLGDRRIIGLPWFFRKWLVNGLIVPFRSFRSSNRYRQLWNNYNQQFPLLLYGEACRDLLQKAVGDNASVFLGMCYGKPDIKTSIDRIIQDHYSRLIILPMFPQYASSSTGVAIEMSFHRLKQYPVIPEIRTIHSFCEHPAFIHAFAEKVKTYHPEIYEKVLFTFHSLPMSHVKEAAPTGLDYPTACMKTARLIAGQLNLPDNHWEIAYQSPMSGPWLEPFADQKIEEYAAQGTKSILIVAPSFVADCLETTLELGKEYKQLFLNRGGHQCDLVESLNDSHLWIQCLKELISC